MREYANWVTARSHRPVMVCSVVALAPFILVIGQLLVVLTAATLVLTSLRNGARAAITAAVASSAIMVLAAMVSGVSPMVVVVLVVVAWPGALILAELLRSTQSLSLAVQVAMIIGMLAVGLAYLIGDPVSTWARVLIDVQELLGSQAQGAQPQALWEQLPLVLTGLVVATTLLSMLVALMLGRWWYCALERPGHFGEEFRQLRMGKVLTLLAALVFVGAPLSGAGMLANMAMVGALGFLLQGLALAHFAAARAGTKPIWMGVFYTALIALPQVVALPLTAAGFLDNWLDFRRRFDAR